MQISTTPITCNGKVLASRILIPETILEMFIGLRQRTLIEGEAMLWYFKKPHLQLFDTFGCLHPIGYLALDKDKKVRQKGVMQVNKTKLVTCSYWIELLPEVINGIVVGDTKKIGKL
ncbi:MAG: hypothetical protein Q8L68_00315 [Methylococcales bacterium]|nr:hypothetical protein [Methylococcales bacterium]